MIDSRRGAGYAAAASTDDARKTRTVNGSGAGVAIRAKLALVRPRVAAAAERMWATPPPVGRYAEYLCAMHAVIRASAPLLAAAARRCDALGGDDPVAVPLGRYLRAHRAEETGHDAWLLADLAALGRDPAEPWRRVPPPEVADLVGAQCYWVEHHHPACLLGYVAVLEGTPPTPAFVDRLVATTGQPRAAFRTLDRHAALDPTHAADLWAVLDALPLPADLAAAVGLSALHTAAGVARLFDRLAALTPAVPGRTA